MEETRTVCITEIDFYPLPNERNANGVYFDRQVIEKALKKYLKDHPQAPISYGYNEDNFPGLSIERLCAKISSIQYGKQIKCKIETLNLPKGDEFRDLLHYQEPSQYAVCWAANGKVDDKGIVESVKIVYLVLIHKSQMEDYKYLLN